MQTDEEITRILRECKTIAVVGCSPRPDRDSHEVAEYLISAGYRVIPVNPKETEILGERCYPTVSAIPERVDLVDVFRRPEDVPAVAEDALRKGVRAFWMQLGIRHAEAAARLRAAGVAVVEDRCTLVEHRARQR
jgi:predicted CoA-binding protein